MRHRLVLLPALSALSALLLALAACAPAPIYKAAPNAVAATPTQVALSPERYAGGPVIWGGRIVEVKNFADHSEIQVLSYPLDNSQRPSGGHGDSSGNGRFIALVPGYVEAMNYPAGAMITVSGNLKGSRAGLVGEANYVFPLVDTSQSHVWTAEEMRSGHPNISFGVGVGVIR